MKSLHKNDVINLLSLLTLRKVLNVIRVWLSYHLSKWRKKPIHWGKPFTISIEPTTACNLECPECPSGLRSFTRPTGNLKSNFFKEIVDQLYKDLIFLIFYFQGEPYINPRFLEMVKYAKSKGIYTITSTNGHFLNEVNAKKTILSGLDRLIISVDGTTQEVYESYRKKGKLDVVIRGAQNVIKWKKKLNSSTPHVIFQFLVVRPNEMQIPDLLDLANEIGIDEVKLKTAQLYDFKQGNPLMPMNPKYSRYKQNSFGKYELKNPLLNQCWKLWHSCVVTWDGIVVPCCFDKDSDFPMGDLKTSSFRNIWTGISYMKFRNKILKGRKEITICQNCTEGCKVWESI